MSTDIDARQLDAKAALAEAIDAVPLIDHHVHGTLRATPTRAELEDMLSESDRPVPAWTSLFDSQVGLAIRRWCAPLLDLPPGTDATDYVAHRSELGEDEVNRRLLTATGVERYLVDTGLTTERISGVEDVAAASGARVHEIVRLETAFEEAVDAQPDARTIVATFEESLRRRTVDAVGLKSIIAYRYGFDFDPERPPERDVIAALENMLSRRRPGTRPRVTDPVLLRHLLWCGIEIGLPIQLHTGFGDPMLELHRCDPLLLTRFIKNIENHGTDITLLHCYPYHRNAGFLAESFPGIYFDMGLGVHYTGLRSDALIAESLELAPFAKILYSSDGWGPAELHYLGAKLWRRGLVNTFAPWLAAGEIDLADATRIAHMIGHDNALRLYQLDTPSQPAAEQPA